MSCDETVFTLDMPFLLSTNQYYCRYLSMGVDRDSREEFSVVIAKMAIIDEHLLQDLLPYAPLRVLRC